MTITTKTTKTKRQAAGRSSSKSSGAGEPRRPAAQSAKAMTGAELKDRRLRLGLSQAAFGALIGVSRYTVARAEHGAPSENVVMRVAIHGRGSSS